MENMFSDIPSDLPEELCQCLLQSESVRIERIISHGHRSPTGFWYDQEHHEWVLVLRGRARLQIKGSEAVELKLGDYVNLPARTPHRVVWTDPSEPTIWLAIHYTDTDLGQT